MSPTVFVKLTDGSAKMPTRRSLGAAGYDLYASQRVRVPPHATAKISTGVVIQIGERSKYARVCARNDTFTRFGIQVIESIIDCDFRDTIVLVVRNTNRVPLLIPVHSCLAQLIFHRIDTPRLEEVTELLLSDRDVRPFGCPSFSAEPTPSIVTMVYGSDDVHPPKKRPAVRHAAPPEQKPETSHAGTNTDPEQKDGATNTDPEKKDVTTNTEDVREEPDLIMVDEVVASLMSDYTHV